ncbi:hypothetical protein NUACC21_39050 [Scytonema sp. NUACC21]
MFVTDNPTRPIYRCGVRVEFTPLSPIEGGRSHIQFPDLYKGRVREGYYPYVAFFFQIGITETDLYHL